MSDNFDSLHSEARGPRETRVVRRRRVTPRTRREAGHNLSCPQRQTRRAARGGSAAPISPTPHEPDRCSRCARRRKQAPRNKSPAANKRLRQARCSLARQAGDLRINMDGDLGVRPAIRPRITPAKRVCRRSRPGQLGRPQGVRKLKLIARLANGLKEIWFFPKVAQQLIGPRTQRRDLCMPERTEPSHRFVDRSLSRSPCLITFVKRNGSHSELQGHLFYPGVCEKDVGLLAISKQRCSPNSARCRATP